MSKGHKYLKKCKKFETCESVPDSITGWDENGSEQWDETVDLIQFQIIVEFKFYIWPVDIYGSGQDRFKILGNRKAGRSRTGSIE